MEKILKQIRRKANHILNARKKGKNKKKSNGGDGVAKWNSNDHISGNPILCYPTGKPVGSQPAGDAMEMKSVITNSPGYGALLTGG